MRNGTGIVVFFALAGLVVSNAEVVFNADFELSMPVSGSMSANAGTTNLNAGASVGLWSLSGMGGGAPGAIIANSTRTDNAFAFDGTLSGDVNSGVTANFTKSISLSGSAIFEMDVYPTRLIYITDTKHINFSFTDLLGNIAYQLAVGANAAAGTRGVGYIDSSGNYVELVLSGGFQKPDTVVSYGNMHHVKIEFTNSTALVSIDLGNDGSYEVVDALIEARTAGVLSFDSIELSYSGSGSEGVWVDNISVVSASSTPPASLYRNGLALHLDAGRITGISDGAALTSGWPDASGNGYDAFPGVAPTYLADGGGSYPAVRFDGGDDYLQSGVPTGTNASIFVVYANQRNPLLADYSDTLVSTSSGTQTNIHLSASRKVSGTRITQFGGDYMVIGDTNYQARIGADDIVPLDGGGKTLYGTLSNEGLDGELYSHNHDVTLFTTLISSSNPVRTNTVLYKGSLGINAPDSSAVFSEEDACEWAFEFDRNVTLRQLIFAAMDDDADSVRVTIEGGTTYDLTRDEMVDTTAWSGDVSTKVYTFSSPIRLAAGTDVTISATNSINPPKNKFRMFGIVFELPAPAPDYPGFIASSASGVQATGQVDGRETADAGTDIFTNRYYIGSAVYTETPPASSLFIGARDATGSAAGRNDIREILVYDHALSNADRNSVIEYLGDKYQIEVVSRDLNHPIEAYNHILGSQQIGWNYSFGESNSQILDAARAFYRQGTRVFKTALSDQYRTSSITNLTSLVRDNLSMRAIFDMPFTDMLCWANSFSVPKWAAVATSNGLDSATQQLIYDEIYDFTAYLLTSYNGTGKTFYIGNWEGDWLLAGEGSTDPENDITPAKINGMIDWVTVRQQAVDDAKAATPHNNVEVWHYLEMNKVDWAIDGAPCVVNSVMPHLSRLDYVSFSSYTVKNADEATTHAALDYIYNALPAQSEPTGCRLIIGEYGYWRSDPDMTQEEHAQAFIDKIKHYLSWSGGPPVFILQWEFYWYYVNNGVSRDAGQIDEMGTRHAIYYMHENFYRTMRRWVEECYETCGRVPSDAEYAAKALQVIDRVSLTEYVPDLSRPVPYAVLVEGSPTAYIPSGQSCSTTVESGYGQILQGSPVSWSVVPVGQGVTIDSNGWMSVSGSATPGTYTVYAVSDDNLSAAGSVQVIVSAHYDAWASQWGGVDIGTGTNDFDGDGVKNIYEFGLGGNPTNANDKGSLPAYTMLDDGGTNIIRCVYPRRSNPDSGLSYYLETTKQLTPAAWTNAGYSIEGIYVTGGEFDFVTNVVEMVPPRLFIRLIIQ